MKNLGLISAIGKNNELGIDNHLIWHIKEDLAFYKRMTMGKNVIMGRKTYESMPPKALIGRKPIILSTRNLDITSDIITFSSLDALLNYIDKTDEEFLVVGGANVYKELLNYVDYMYLTEINMNFVADTYFPSFDENDFNKVMIDNYMDNDIPYIRNKYVRKRVNNG